MLLIDDLTSGDADMQPQSLAHGVITLEKLTPLYGTERRRLKISKLRGSTFRGGYHDFNLETGGIRVFPRLIAGEHKSHFKAQQVGSGLDSLDKALGGGLEFGSSTLISGSAGTGKSSLCAQFGYEGPILALTAHALEEDKTKSMMAGFDAHFTKPILGGELINAVRPYKK